MLELAFDTAQLQAVAESLTPIPAAVMRLNELMLTSAPSVREVEEVVSFDAALAATVLQSANSAMYARQRPASTVRDAILRIGTTGLVGVAMRMATSGAMRADLPAYGLPPGELLDHSARAAAAAEALRRHAPARVPAPATVAALLHDTGKLVLNELVGDRFASLVSDLAAGSERRVWQIEQEVFGTDHAAVAVHLGRHWRLPAAIVDGMVHHHEPSQGTAVAHAVYLADVLARATLGTEPDDVETLKSSLDALSIEFSDLDDLATQTFEIYESSVAVEG
jgi:HD-like signal output (HDOD) protein